MQNTLARTLDQALVQLEGILYTKAHHDNSDILLSNDLEALFLNRAKQTSVQRPEKLVLLRNRSESIIGRDPSARIGILVPGPGPG